jgi:hypothetical protein
MRASKERESDGPYRIGAGLVVEALVSVKILFADEIIDPTWLRLI